MNLPLLELHRFDDPGRHSLSPLTGGMLTHKAHQPVHLISLFEMSEL